MPKNKLKRILEDLLRVEEGILDPEDAGTLADTLVARLPAVYIVAPDLLKALEDLFEQCSMVHTRWGEGSNQIEADAAVTAGRAIIAKAKGVYDE